MYAEAAFSNYDEFLGELAECDLNEWETDFVDSLIDNYDQYNDATQISDKQYEILLKMKDKYL